MDNFYLYETYNQAVAEHAAMPTQRLKVHQARRACTKKKKPKPHWAENSKKEQRKLFEEAVKCLTHSLIIDLIYSLLKTTVNGNTPKFQITTSLIKMRKSASPLISLKCKT